MGVGARRFGGADGSRAIARGSRACGCWIVEQRLQMWVGCHLPASVLRAAALPWFGRRRICPGRGSGFVCHEGGVVTGLTGRSKENWITRTKAKLARSAMRAQQQFPANDLRRLPLTWSCSIASVHTPCALLFLHSSLLPPDDMFTVASAKCDNQVNKGLTESGKADVAAFVLALEVGGELGMVSFSERSSLSGKEACNSDFRPIDGLVNLCRGPSLPATTSPGPPRGRGSARSGCFGSGSPVRQTKPPRQIRSCFAAAPGPRRHDSRRGALGSVEPP